MLFYHFIYQQQFFLHSGVVVPMSYIAFFYLKRSMRFAVLNYENY